MLTLSKTLFRKIIPSLSYSLKKFTGLKLLNPFPFKNYMLYNNLSRFKFSEKQTFTEEESLELVESGVFEILKGAAKCKHDKLSRSASFTDLGFDSLDQVELIVAMEEKFNINLEGIFI
jgi:acyl carrier protein